MLAKFHHKNNSSGAYLSSFQRKMPLSTSESGSTFALNPYFYSCPNSSSYSCCNHMRDPKLCTVCQTSVNLCISKRNACFSRSWHGIVVKRMTEHKAFPSPLHDMDLFHPLQTAFTSNSGSCPSLIPGMQVLKEQLLPL